MAALQFKTEAEAREWLRNIKKTGDKPATESISLDDFVAEPKPESGSVPPKAMPTAPAAELEPEVDDDPAEPEVLEPPQPRKDPLAGTTYAFSWVAQIAFQVWWWMLINVPVWTAEEYLAWFWGAVVGGLAVVFLAKVGLVLMTMPIRALMGWR